MGFGPFAYIPFILVFLKFNDGAYDMRQSVHKLMGVVSYLFILINGVTGSGMMLMDIALFLFASFFFYRAMSDNFERVSAGAIVTVAAFAVLSVLANRAGSTPSAKSLAEKATARPSAEMPATEAELRKALETVTKAAQQAQPPPEMP